MPLVLDRPSAPQQGAPHRAASYDPERFAFLAGAAVLLLTSIHHVYGAIRYETPERYHAVVIAGAALALMVIFQAARRRIGSRLARRSAWWAGLSVNAVVAVLLFGAIEGFYNHVIKVAFHFGGMSEERLRWLYRDPLYELPNDVIFEVTGVLQVVPAAFAAYFLTRVVLHR
jgi:hypothetical protein